MKDISSESLYELDHLFRKLVRKYVKERDKIIIEEVSLPAFLILRLIATSGDQRLSELADELDMTSGAITALCDRLEGNGYAERIRNKEDRRIIYLTITEAGKTFIERYDHLGKVNREILFSGLTSEETTQQLILFKKLIDNVEGLSQKLILEVSRKAQLESGTDDRESNHSKSIDIEDGRSSKSRSNHNYLNY